MAIIKNLFYFYSTTRNGLEVVGEVCFYSGDWRGYVNEFSEMVSNYTNGGEVSNSIEIKSSLL